MASATSLSNNNSNHNHMQPLDIVQDDLERPIQSIAFGSCFNNRKVHATTPNIWKAIGQEHPDVFVWTGDVVYPPQRKIANLTMMEALFDNMHTNASIGYGDFIAAKARRDDSDTRPPLQVYGTWDDHDFGGNDVGVEMPDKPARAAAYYKFLQFPTPVANNLVEHRAGLYYSVTLTHHGATTTTFKDDENEEEEDAPPPPPHPQRRRRQVKLIFLDTRWHRGKHCIPSVATKIKSGAGFSAAIRWALAGFKVNQWWPFWECWTTPVLGEEQWTWLENELNQSQADVHIVVSSIQVLTTNPTVESWGHFPQERQRLLSLLGQGHSGLMLLSGDVHQGEIFDPLANHHHQNTKHSFLEVTSSGLTHFCSQPFYGFLCEPLLRHYHQNRYQTVDNYFIGKNYGTIQINWELETAEIFVKNELGKTVLQTGPRPFAQDVLTEFDLQQVAATVDGHMIRPVVQILMALMAIVLIGYYAKLK